MKPKFKPRRMWAVAEGELSNAEVVGLYDTRRSAYLVALGISKEAVPVLVFDASKEAVADMREHLNAVISKIPAGTHSHEVADAILAKVFGLKAK